MSEAEAGSRESRSLGAGQPAGTMRKHKQTVSQRSRTLGQTSKVDMEFKSLTTGCSFLFLAPYPGVDCCVNYCLLKIEVSLMRVKRLLFVGMMISH